MTDQNFFFRWIWRLNALGLLVMLAFGIAAVAVFVGVLPPSAVDRIRTIDTVPPVASPAASLELFIEPPRPGRSQVVLALAPRGRYPNYGKFASGETLPLLGVSVQSADLAHVANYLFIDAATGEERWLFPTNEQTITSTDYVYQRSTTTVLKAGPPATSVDNSPLRAVLYVVSPAGRDAPARSELYASKPDGTGLTKVLDGLDDWPIEMFVSDQATVRYASKGRQMVATISLDDFKAIMTKDVTDLAGK